MGNNASSEGSRPNRPFSRTTGSLGLSKPELEQRCRPSGLYPSWQWEDRAVKRLIANGQLAARQKGSDTRVRMTDHECPICFLHYSQVNQTVCCQADICTECFLQVRPQKEKNCACPFCNSPRLTITVAKTMDTAAIKERQKNEQHVIAAKIRAQETAKATNDDECNNSSGGGGFGSNLEQNTAVRLMRARSESNCSSTGTDVEDVASVAMTAEDRHVLEEEIRAQHTHPLARQVEQEAEERRLENERNYYRSQPERVRELRNRSARMARMSSDSTLLGNRRASNNRNWNEIVQAFEQGGGGGVNSLDDLVVLEAAILLSMAEEDRRREEEGNADGEEAASAANNAASGATFDASQHARQGFPLVQSLLTDANSARNVAARNRGTSGAIRRAGGSSRRARSLRGLSDSHDMSNMLLRGISEAEQIEMAIAMSLQQSQQEQAASASNDEAEGTLQESSPSGAHDEATEQENSGVRVEEGSTSEGSGSESIGTSYSSSHSGSESDESISNTSASGTSDACSNENEAPVATHQVAGTGGEARQDDTVATQTAEALATASSAIDQTASARAGSRTSHERSGTPSPTDCTRDAGSEKLH